jgi:hypothetical protein
MTNRKFSRKRLVQALGLLALGLVLLVGSVVGYSQVAGPPSTTVSATTTANGSLDVELFPGVRLRATFVVDCSSGDPSKHTLRTNTTLSILVIGTEGQPLTAQSITHIQVTASAAGRTIASGLSTGDFTLSTSGGVTIITPILKTSSGQSKICLVPTDIIDNTTDPGFLTINPSCGCTITRIVVTVTPKTEAGGSRRADGFRLIDKPLDSELKIRIELVGEGTIRLDLTPRARALRVTAPTGVAGGGLANLDPKFLLDADARKKLRDGYSVKPCRGAIELVVTLHDFIASGEISMPRDLNNPGGERERVREPDRSDLKTLLMADKQNYDASLDIKLDLNITFLNCSTPNELVVPIAYSRGQENIDATTGRPVPGPFQIRREGEIYYINPAKPDVMGLNAGP